MGKRDFFEEEKINKMASIFGIVLLVSIIAFVIVFTIYNNKLKEQADLSILELGAVNSVVPNENTISTSSSQDKGKNDVKNVANENISSKNNNIAKNSTNTNKNSEQNTVKNTTKQENIVENTNTVNTDNTNVEENKAIENNELNFIAPASGEILKDFADDSLIYSNTLEEWTTHLGIDIKADKTSIVVASETGKIESIKNDPRYGLTITIDHGNNYKTVYSNLLTTEFVQLGESVEKGQTIATVGDTASFEILDEPHLHFEMYKDGNAVNPTLYFK